MWWINFWTIFVQFLRKMCNFCAIFVQFLRKMCRRKYSLIQRFPKKRLQNWTFFVQNLHIFAQNLRIFAQKLHKKSLKISIGRTTLKNGSPAGLLYKGFPKKSENPKKPQNFPKLENFALYKGSLRISLGYYRDTIGFENFYLFVHEI